MTFAKVLDELSSLSFEQRQQLIRHALELDDPPLSEQDEALVNERLARHHADPSTSVPLEKMKKRLRTRLKK